MSGWMPIESAPQDSTEILASFGSWQGVVYWLGSSFSEMPGWHVHDGHMSHPVAAGWPTHWQHLPIPPPPEEPKA